MKKLVLFLLFLLPSVFFGEQIITTEHTSGDSSEKVLKAVIRRFDNDSVWVLTPTIDYSILGGKNLVEKKQVFKKKLYLIGKDAGVLKNDDIFSFLFEEDSVIFSSYKEKIDFIGFSRKETEKFKCYLKEDTFYVKPEKENKEDFISWNFIFLFLISIFFLILLANKKRIKNERKISICFLSILILLFIFSLIFDKIIHYQEVFIPSVGVLIFFVRSIFVIFGAKKRYYLISDLIWYIVFLLISLMPICLGLISVEINFTLLLGCIGAFFMLGGLYTFLNHQKIF